MLSLLLAFKRHYWILYLFFFNAFDCNVLIDRALYQALILKWKFVLKNLVFLNIIQYICTVSKNNPMTIKSTPQITYLSFLIPVNISFSIPRISWVQSLRSGHFFWCRSIVMWKILPVLHNGEGTRHIWHRRAKIRSDFFDLNWKMFSSSY